jgi:hypothetical protein
MQGKEQKKFSVSAQILASVPVLFRPKGISISLTKPFKMAMFSDFV